jgi:micrococcal nuclease
MMRTKFVLVFVTVAFVTGVCLGAVGMYFLMWYGNAQLGDISSSQSSYEYQGTVTRIIDGDTIQVDDIRVRLVGIDTPERGEPGFSEATEFTASLCPVGSSAALDIDDLEPKDRYGRTLAVVYCGGVNINQELLRNRYAEIMYIPPSQFDPYSWYN